MSVDFKDYYRILGVSKDADDKTIKSAYRRLARKYHPDVAKTKDSGERFKEISEAYEFFRTVFGDLGGRRPGRGGDAGGIFGSRRPRRGDDVQANVEITLEEAFGGTRRTFTLDLDEPCPTCQGAGNVKGQPCATCHGG